MNVGFLRRLSNLMKLCQDFFSNLFNLFVGILAYLVGCFLLYLCSVVAALSGFLVSRYLYPWSLGTTKKYVPGRGSINFA